jgi:hypothetical protein
MLVGCRAGDVVSGAGTGVGVRSFIRAGMIVVLLLQADNSGTRARKRGRSVAGRAGKTGGAPPKLDEEFLRSRFGQSGVDLIAWLRRLRAEGGFSYKDAVTLWAESDPHGATAFGVLSSSGKVDPRRVTELLQLRKGPLPGALVKTFLDLWVRGADPEPDTRNTTATTVQRLCREVKKAADLAGSPTAPQGARRAHQRELSEEVGRLKDKLIEVQGDLLRTREDKAQLEKLTMVLVLAVHRLHIQHEQLRDERNALAAAAARQESDARSAAIVAARTERVGDQLVRAEHQLDRTRQEITQLAVLAEDLKRLLLELTARLDTVSAALPVVAPGPVVTEDVDAGDPVGEQLVADTDVALDRVEDMLQTTSEHRAQSRRHLVTVPPVINAISAAETSDDVPVEATVAVIDAGSAPGEGTPNWTMMSGVVHFATSRTDNPQAGDDVAPAADNSGYGDQVAAPAAHHDALGADVADPGYREGRDLADRARPDTPAGPVVGVLPPTAAPIDPQDTAVAVGTARATGRPGPRTHRRRRFSAILVSTVFVTVPVMASTPPEKMVSDGLRNVDFHTSSSSTSSTPVNTTSASGEIPVPESVAGTHLLYTTKHEVKDVRGDVAKAAESPDNKLVYFLRWNLNGSKGGNVTFTLTPDPSETVQDITSFLNITPSCAQVKVEITFASGRGKANGPVFQITEGGWKSPLIFTGMDKAVAETITISAFDVGGAGCPAAFYWGPFIRPS